MASVCGESQPTAWRLSVYGIPMSHRTIKLSARELLSLITEMCKGRSLYTVVWDDGYQCRSVKRERGFVLGHKRFQPLLW